MDNQDEPTNVIRFDPKAQKKRVEKTPTLGNGAWKKQTKAPVKPKPTLMYSAGRIVQGIVLLVVFVLILRSCGRL